MPNNLELSLRIDAAVVALGGRIERVSTMLTERIEALEATCKSVSDLLDDEVLDRVERELDDADKKDEAEKERPTMSDAKHSPTPWLVAGPYDGKLMIRTDGEGPLILIADMNANPRGYGQEGNAYFIIRACNSHDALLAACERAENLFRHGDNSDDGAKGAWPELVAELRAAIARAQPEKEQS